MSSKISPRLVFIGEGVYLANPLESGLAAKEKDAPTLILIFGWMGARLEHLYKYTETYDKLYPEATQILIRCENSFFWSRKSKLRALMDPVITILGAHGYISLKSSTTKPDTEHRVLIHTFSNGGCGQLVNMTESISHRGYSAPHWPGVIIFDSTPGINTSLSSTIRAFTGSTQSLIVRFFITALILVSYLVLPLLAGSTFARWRKIIARPDFVPWMDERTPRLYVFSKDDQLVPWEKVWKHGDEARKAGVKIVEREVFEASAHVAHARADPDRYWRAVTEMWKAAA